MSQDEDPYRDLAQWLQEAARRKYAEPVSRRLPDPDELRRQAALAARERWRAVRQGMSFAVLAAAYLQYHLLDVMLQIETMPSVVVFV